MTIAIVFASEDFYSYEQHNNLMNSPEQTLNGCKWKMENKVIKTYCSLYFKWQPYNEFNMTTKLYSIHFIFKTYPEAWKNNVTYLYPHYAELRNENGTDKLDPTAIIFPLSVKLIVNGYIKEYLIKMEFQDYVEKPVAYFNIEKLNLSRLSQEFSPCQCGLTIFQNPFWPSWKGYGFQSIIFFWINIWQEYLLQANITEVTLTLSESITELSPSLNYLKDLNIFMFSCYKCGLTVIRFVAFFPNIHILKFPFNKIKNIDQDAFLSVPNLVKLDLKGNLLSALPNSIFYLPKLLFANFAMIKPNSNVFSLEENFNMSSNMISLTLTQTVLKYLTNKSFECCPLLKILYLKNCEIVNIFQDSFRGLDQLVFLDVSENKIRNFDKKTFEDLRELHTLLLNNNRIDTIEESLFRSLTKLTVLDLSENQIKYLPIGVFQNLTNLQSINLFKNKLVFWEHNTFRHLPSLKILNISRNYITALDESMIEDLKHIKKVWITENPFDCNSCHLPHLIKWLKERISSDSYFLYNCAFTKENPKWITVMNVKFNEKLCIVTSINYFFNVGIPLIVLAFIIIMLVIMIYRYQRHIRMKASGYRRLKNSNKFKYDVFISYSSKDFLFVEKIIYKMIDYDFKICLDESNFLAGNEITNDIINNINNSKKVIFVLSENFVRNEFYKFEIQMAEHWLFKRNDVLILLKYGYIPANIISKKLRNLINVHGYLEWNDSQEMAVFWQHFENALKKNMFFTKDNYII